MTTSGEGGGDGVPAIAQVHHDPPYRGRVLVFAPHPDDESIGPGATLAKHVRLGDRVAAVFVTSGVHGDAAGRYDPAEYVELRRNEARAAAHVLGIGSTEFWDYPDSMEVTEGDLEAVAERVLDACNRFEPDVIYVPHVREAHPDHHHVARAMLRARELARAAGKPLAARLLGYEVWSPLDADLVVDVTDTFTLKLDAIRRYGSQLEETDIIRAVDGLNRFRAILMPHQTSDEGLWAEVFEDLG